MSMTTTETISRFPGKWEWLGLAFEGERMVVARVRGGHQRPKIVNIWSGSSKATAFDRLFLLRELAGHRVANKSPSVVVLEESDHEVLTLDEPDVGNLDPSKKIQALRWSVQPLVGFGVEKASLDILIQAGTLGRRQVMVAVAPEDKIAPWADACSRLRVSLKAIDVRETAQRNMAHLFESDKQTLAFLNILGTRALLTISSDGELLMTRRIEVGNVLEGSARDRLGLEVQRTLDNFDRQGGHATASELVVAGSSFVGELAIHLNESLGIQVNPLSEARIRSVIDIGDEVFMRPENWGYLELLAIGTACRGGSA